MVNMLNILKRYPPAYQFLKIATIMTVGMFMLGCGQKGALYFPMPSTALSQAAQYTKFLSGEK